MRVLATVLALVGALAWTAVGLGAGEPKQRITAADQKRAKGMLVRRVDLGRGWTATRGANRDTGDFRCPGWSPDESDLTVTGDATSPEFTYAQAPSYAFVGSTASVYRTAAQASTSWRRGVKPGLVRCLAAFLQKEAGGSGAILRVTAKGALAVPRTAPQSAGYRVVATTTAANGVTLRFYVDLILLRNDRALAGVFVVSLLQPPTALERGLARLVSARMAKAMRAPPAG